VQASGGRTEVSAGSLGLVVIGPHWGTFPDAAFGTARVQTARNQRLRKFYVVLLRWAMLGARVVRVGG